MFKHATRFRRLRGLVLGLALVGLLPVGALAVSPDPASLPVSSSLTSLRTTYTPVYSVNGTEGHWLSGCQITAINNLGWPIYSMTIWQEYKAIYKPIAEQKITYWPASYSTSRAYYGWVLTSESHSHWKIDIRTGAAQSNFTFTQYVAGQPYQSRSGYVRVTDKAAGTWSCMGNT